MSGRKNGSIVRRSSAVAVLVIIALISFSGCLREPLELDDSSELTHQQEDLSGEELSIKEGAHIDQSTVMERFRGEFVPIPAGRLPDGTVIRAMEASRYPVTREVWQEIMGNIPDHWPTDERYKWDSLTRAPVTYVDWENKDGSAAEVQFFIKRLNRREASHRYRYDLPSNKELWYLIRADHTGENRDIFSTGVNENNVHEFYTHEDSPDSRVHTVGLKRLNAFGLELGNVWKLSKDIFDPNAPLCGRSLRGGVWRHAGRNHHLFSSEMPYCDGAGVRSEFKGFTLVRRGFQSLASDGPNVNT